MPHLRVFGLVLAVLLAASCSSRTDERPRAEQAVNQFHAAFKKDDGAAACALLAPQTRHEVEKSAEAPCDQAITDADLPDLGRLQATDVYGNEARIVADGDTVFVSDFDGA